MPKRPKTLVSYLIWLILVHHFLLHIFNFRAFGAYMSIYKWLMSYSLSPAVCIMHYMQTPTIDTPTPPPIYPNLKELLNNTEGKATFQLSQKPLNTFFNCRVSTQKSQFFLQRKSTVNVLCRLGSIHVCIFKIVMSWLSKLNIFGWESKRALQWKSYLQNITALQERQSRC